MFSAVSGLQSHSTWLDVIGNNISNVNTVAFKSSRVTFANAISQTMSGGSGASTASNLGGVNPQQVGLGSRVSSIQTLFTPGNIQTTGNATDIAINGNGFLVVKQGNETFYSRAGNLTFDGSGNLVDANGGLVQGFTASVTYTTRELDSRATGSTGLITDASLALNNNNTSAIGNITIDSNMTLPPRATTIMNVTGNLDSFLQATDTERGGAFVFGAAGGNNDLLPLGTALDQGVAIIDSNKAQVDLAEPYSLEQLEDYSLWDDPTTERPVIVAGVDLTQCKNNGDGYAWNTGVEPAHSMTQTVYDSLGNPREVTINFYQVNDLGDGGLNDSNGPSQVAYAWYAFETTGGVAVSTDNLLGGTAIVEGDTGSGFGTLMGFDRGNDGTQYCGDLLYFNTDGSLATSGGVAIGGTGTLTASEYATPMIYLPALNDPAIGDPISPLPTVGAEVLAIDLNFGTAGALGTGQRDGLYCDAAGSYEVVNGINTYIPNHTAMVESQDGYSEGTLTGLNFDANGIVQGTFSTTGGDKTVALAQIVLASVANEEGLNSVGGNYYTTSNNTGSVYVGLAGQNGLGTVTGYALESSNVDLTTELTNMIIAQRGFEVNARSITTTNETLQTLVQLGR